MIIRASHRSDIPAFYSDWFVNRVKAGYCAVPNPFNRKQVSYISLKPEEVKAIITGYNTFYQLALLMGKNNELHL